MTKTLAKYIFAEETLYNNVEWNMENGQSVEILTINNQQLPISKEPINPVINSQVPIPSQVINNEIAIKKEPETIPIPKSEIQNRLTILVLELSDEDKTFLTKILAAVGVNFEDVDLIELKKIPTLNRQEWIGQKKTNYFISFGVGLAKLGWQVLLPPYQQKTMDGVQFLLTDDLKNIASNVLLKKKLWEVLQKMFPKK